MIFGVDYYPEHWEEYLWENDAHLMKEAGINVVRIAEFCWSVIEKTEGCFDFSLFDRAIELMSRYGIKCIIGTPTATPPAWICEKIPDIFPVDCNGDKINFGARRHYCYNNLQFREYVGKVVKEMGNHYKNNQNVIGFQIDNELGHENSDKCYCKLCEEAFPKWIKENYFSLDTVNEVFGTRFWSQTYTKWEQIPLPKKTLVPHNPALELNYRRFMSSSIIDFMNFQVDILKAIVGEDKFITHNAVTILGGSALDLRKLSKSLEFISYDNYPVWGGLEEPIPPHHNAFLLSGIYGLKNRKYWVMEELAGAQGHRIIGYLPRPGQLKLWSLQALARGAEALVYFRWRAAHFGAEQFCHGIIDHDNIPKRKYAELRETISEIKSLGSGLDKAESKSRVGFIHDFDNMWSWQVQPLSHAFDYKDEMIKFYKPLYQRNISTDIIGVESNFDEYKILVAPILTIVNNEVSQKLKSFVKKGGHLVLTYRACAKDENNNLKRTTLPCDLRQLAGISIDEYESLQVGQKNKVIGLTGSLKEHTFYASVWSDIINCEGAKALATYDETFYTGKAAITANDFGNGKVYYIGCSPDELTLLKLFDDIIEGAGLKAINSPEGVEVVDREYKGKIFRFLINHNNYRVDFQLDGNEYSLENYGSQIKVI